MEEFEEDEDVVLEGSEFHRMLQDTGYTDFKPILISRHQSIEESQYNNKLFDTASNLFTQRFSLNIFDKPKVSYLSGKQIAVILQAETLLDDHAEFVENLLKKNSQSFWCKLSEWSTLIASTVIIGINYLMQERKKTLVTLIASSVAAIAIYRKTEEFCAIRSLENLVSLQNDLHHLYKKSLRIMIKGFQFRSNSKQASRKFSHLDVDRLKFVQPLTETLLKSLTNVGRIYYQTSLLIFDILPKNRFDDFFIRFEDEAFNTDGEIIYDQFKQLYYDYMTMQSDAMQLLAIAYDADTWRETGKIPHSKLVRIITKLERFLWSHKTQLARILKDYENCKPKPIQRTFRGQRSSKWRDLYLNLDLLSRKLATAYDAIGTILKEIEKQEDTKDDDSIVELTPRINDIYKQIDSARNFAEFSNLLMVILKRSGEREENILIEKSTNLPEIANDRIIRDSEPQIIDEVFEEYITEEYLKPLYDDNDEVGDESSKLDKLLAKNFMSELKEALVEKYKTMSEREAKALLRKYREIHGDNEEKREIVESSIPCPPPLPSLDSGNIRPGIVASKREKENIRSPVPLPRKNVKPQNPKDISSDSAVKQRQLLSIPSPPPPPPKIEVSEENDKFLIGLPINAVRKMPAFVTFEEEFIGSGENSEEETANDDNDDDEDVKTTEID